jgi:SAM-dependent methyltransferase
VQGQEVDENAAHRARSIFGVPVFCGPLDQSGFHDEQFDAVVMNHVIEHVHDPVGLLRQSKRLLKPGGHLISITPNASGWGHKRFATSWHGLDPPRHLFLFSRNTMERMASVAGFRDVRTWTTAARSVWIVGGSLRIERGEAVHSIGPLITRAIRQAFLQLQAVLVRRADPNAGDECVLSARG